MEILKKLIIWLDKPSLSRIALFHLVLLLIYTGLWLTFPSLQNSLCKEGNFIVAMISIFLMIAFVASAIIVLMCLSVPIIKIILIILIRPALSTWKKIVNWAQYEEKIKVS